VETMTPSARKRATLLPSSSTAKSPMRAMSPLEMTRSFRALIVIEQRAAPPQLGMQHGARIESMAALAAAVPTLQRRIEVGEANFSKETEITQVHAKDGRTGGGKMRATDKSVPSRPAR